MNSSLKTNPSKRVHRTLTQSGQFKNIIFGLVYMGILSGLAIYATKMLHSPTNLNPKATLSPTPIPYYGKGLIYYTENYERNYSDDFKKYDVPIPDTDPDAKKAFVASLKRGTQCSRYYDLTEPALQMMEDLDLQFVILGFGPASWYNLAPTKPADATNPTDPAYKFETLDLWIAKVSQRGIKPVLQLWGTPTWASGKTNPAVNGCTALTNKYVDYQPYNAHPKDLNDYANFVKAVATRYDGKHAKNPLNPTQYLKVDDFSLWNEPNLPDFWEGGVDAYADFATLHNLGYTAIKNARPANDSIVWGVNLSGACCRATEFVDKMIGSTALNYDIFSTHAYPAYFNEAPRTSVGAFYDAARLETLLQRLDSRADYRGKTLAVTETGYRSNWESNSFGPAFAEIRIDESQKSTNLLSMLNLFNETNWRTYVHGRIVAVANNVLYNPWRWWSTGIANYYDPTTKSLTYQHKTHAYSIFKNWSLERLTPFDAIDSATMDSKGGYWLFKGDRYWYRASTTSPWKTNTLASLVATSDNSKTVNVPTSNYDAAYYGLADNFTIVKGDRYWFRLSPTSTWYSNTLQSAYSSSANASSIGVPSSAIDTAYFDSKGGYTVIKGNEYWYRSSNAANWLKDRLATAYAKPQNSQQIGLPTTGLSAAYYGNGGYTIIKGDRYWFVKDLNSTTATWYSNTLTQAFAP